MAAIVCPACQSEVSADGKSLLKRSDWLVKVSEDAEMLPRLEKAIEILEARYSASDKIEKGGKRVQLDEESKEQPWWKRK